MSESKSGLKRLYQKINDVVIDQTKEMVNEAQPTPEKLPALESVDLKTTMIDLNELNSLSKITVEPDRKFLKHLRESAAKETSHKEACNLKKDFEKEFRSLMHTSVKAIAEQCHACSKTHGFRSDWLNTPEKLMLIVSELGEAMEAYRHIDPKFLAILMETPEQARMELPEGLEDSVGRLANFQEELADVLIRLLDLMHALGIDIEATTANKMAINELRPHRHGKHC